MLRLRVSVLPLLLCLGASTTACTGETLVVRTFAGHCEALLDESNRAWDFKPESIRRDFVNWYDSIAVAAAAYDFLNDAPPDSDLLVELRRLRMVGAWSEERELHYANSLLFEPEDGMQRELTFDGLVEDFRRYTELDSPFVESDLQRCLFTAMNAYFEGITIHGNPGQEVRLPLAYFMAEYDSEN